MKKRADPNKSLWPENCEGSRKALVIFIGPSPGGKIEKARDVIKINQIKPLWNEPYLDPLGWSHGFRVSFRPIVEAIFQREFEEASKLIARMNMDWEQNPESSSVPYYYMWIGCSAILPVIYECNPELIIPMDEKTYGILQIALVNDGFQIIPAKFEKINILIYQKEDKERFHDNLFAFKAIKDQKPFIIIKSWQHPARIFDANYANRIGNAIRSAAIQIYEDRAVNLSLI